MDQDHYGGYIWGDIGIFEKLQLPGRGEIVYTENLLQIGQCLWIMDLSDRIGYQKNQIYTKPVPV